MSASRIACLVVLWAGSCLPVSAAQLFFSRDFPGSSPAYFDITIEADGAAAYREAPDEDPLKFQVDAATVTELLNRAEAVEALGPSVASKRKVAFTGNKVLRLSDDGRQQEAKFMYSENQDAQYVVSWFLKAAETIGHRINLERAVRFDRLGVNDALLQLQGAFERDRVVAADQLIPVLEQITGQEKILHLARSRAAALLERIQAAEPAPAAP
ncbi:MAG: hypothetical protein GC160_22215 [Acidobacteria bacterium]|nr:hypothetical protein [Acidobacteriota bacterium]